MAGKIFINYRRDDSGGTAGRLYDRLAQTFGRKNLFMDVDHIPAGADFVEHLDSQVAACDVFLAVIGPNWLEAKDDDGHRRFDNPHDFVTTEIAAALARKIPVIPVLVDGARTPKADKLPDSIKPLVRRNAVELRNTNFGRDADALADKVREVLKSVRPLTRRWLSIAGATARLRALGRWQMVALSATALLLVGWVLYQSGVLVGGPWTPRAEQPDAQAKATAAEEAKQQPAPPLGARVPAAVAPNDAEAQRKAAEAEQQRLAAAKVEEERKAKAAAEAEAQRKAAEAEQQRLAAAKVEEERRKQAEAEARYSVLVSQSSLAFDAHDYDLAITTASEAIRLNPKIADAFAIRARAYGRKGDDDRALADANEAIRLDPNSPEAFATRSAAYGRKGDLDRALADADEAIRRAPNSPEAFNSRGVAYARKGDYARAISDYNEAIRLNPNYAVAFNNRGVAYENSDLPRAIADYSQATRLNRIYAMAFCNLGKAKLRAKQASGNADIAKARELGASSCR